MPRSPAFLARPAHPAAGRWQGAVILAPLLLLTALGIRGLYVSVQAALDGARRECRHALDEAYSSLSTNWMIMRLTPPLRLYPAPPIPVQDGEVNRLYDAALALPGASRLEALAALTQLEKDHPDACLASGVPLFPLAEWNRLKLETEPAAVSARAAALRHAALYSYPSVLTPKLLTAATALLQQRGLSLAPLESWQADWNGDEQARSVWRQHRKEVDTANAAFWLRGANNQMWWVELTAGNDPDTRRFLSYEALVAFAQKMAAEMQASLPDYARLSVTLGKVRLSQLPDESLAESNISGLNLSVVLASPERLYAQQRQQTFWLFALLVSALAAALAGYYAMRRALASEQRLGQLKSDFVSSVSHELRAPVASMRLMAENLEAGVVTDDVRRQEYHRHISQECRRLSALIDNVLDFARIEQDRKVYDFVETDVSALVRDALDFMQPQAAQRHHALRSELSTIDPPPFCDGLAVRQAILNLLDNAIKFSPEGTTISLRLHAPSAETWELAVADEGLGIPASDHKAIFERFYRRGSELRRETQGAGIGLSIVEHIARAHGGCVRLESEVGAGAIFTLVLPLRPPGVARVSLAN